MSIRRKATLLAAGAAYLAWAVRRNRSLLPPPVRDPDGQPLPGGEIELSDGERVAYVDAGPAAERDAPSLFWIPGADGVKETWRRQLPAFSSAHRCVSADLRRRIDDRHGFDRLADDAAEAIESLGAAPAVVIGQSLGGAIAIRLTTRRPELVRGLVLCNTLTRVSYEHLGLNRTALVPLAIGTTRYLPTPLARAAARGWSRLSVWIYDDSPGRDALVEYALWTGPRTVPPRVSSGRVGLLKGEDLRPELGSIGAPTLVVKGPLDSYCPPEWSREIAAGIPGARYVEVEGTGHCSHVSRPGAFNRIVRAWLEETLGRRPAPPVPAPDSPASSGSGRPQEGEARDR